MRPEDGIAKRMQADRVTIFAPVFSSDNIGETSSLSETEGLKIIIKIRCDRPCSLERIR